MSQASSREAAGMGWGSGGDRAAAGLYLGSSRGGWPPGCPGEGRGTAGWSGVGFVPRFLGLK
ncbi:hypothetical protein MFU01_77380 [Myxococcus fulvus]|uniref:Uncharacterized protein n=1 Tax=Myxococcus fulvus TaxID=33 RepID=A0A511TEW0_MYXFU|nr:hypothetical protein MFU01_77380 [Myxococcus fulvus]